MSHAAVYVIRSDAGAAVRAARFVHARGHAEWVAPPAARSVAESVHAAAQWIKRQLDAVPGSPALTLVLDLDGARCAWMSAEGSDEETVVATLNNARLQSEVGSGDGATTPVSWLGDHEIASDLSVQPLTATKTKRAARGAAAPSDSPKRLAVLATADLGARMLLDELDTMGVTPARVVSLWHILDEGWHGDLGAMRGRGGEAAPAAATIVIDPSGRLAWSWSGDQGLLACGSMLLRRTESAPNDDAGTGDAAAPAMVNGNGTPAIVEVTRSDVGRLVAEWLAWATQLGIAPARLSCVGPGTLTSTGLDTDLPDTPSVAAMGQTIGRQWPQTVVAAQIDDDPVLTTLRKSVVAANDLGLPGATKAAPEANADGRLGLLELSRRPGRASRKVYLWNFVLLIAAGAVVFALGLKLQQVAGDLHKREQERRAAIGPLVKRVASFAPIPADAEDPQALLVSKLVSLREDAKKIVFEQPVLSEFLNVLRALDGVTADINSVQIGSVMASRVDLYVTDAEAGNIFAQRLNEIPATGAWLQWSAGRTSPPRKAPDGREVRDYAIGAVWKAAPKKDTKNYTPVPRQLKPVEPPAAPSPDATPKPADAASGDKHGADKPSGTGKGTKPPPPQPPPDEPPAEPGDKPAEKPEDNPEQGREPASAPKDVIERTSL